MTAGFACTTCGTALRPAAKFCDECGTAVTAAKAAAEYKQVTVLFADVVHSMDIAAAVGPERLREIMSELVRTASAVVQRFGGTVDKFTGDGLMAVFGAPVALEDHAFRACLAALAIQNDVARLTVDVARRDEISLQLRVGLNSGQVIVGEIGDGALGYTAIGEQVGMAQRMESAAPPGGVMLSESTARLVENAAVLAEPELVPIKGASMPVPARRLIATTSDHRRRSDPQLVGRTWELNTVTALLDEATDGVGCVVGVLGPPGIGKSRIVRESAALAAGRGIPVFTTYCESHTSDVPFQAVTGLLRAALGIDGMDHAAARAEVRDRIDGADAEDLRLLDDLLGIGDPSVDPLNIEADARRRRLTALVNAASLARREPALYVVEDAHWIDEVSESMLANFFTVIPQTPSMVLITYRPEYRGALTSIPGSQTIALRPLNAAQTATLIGELLGTDASVFRLTEVISERVAGNPFFVQEIVRDLSERGAIHGEHGAFLLADAVTDITVPATLHAAIASRVDRLSPGAKRTLSAAAVIGSRFAPELVTALGIEPALVELTEAELVDQVGFTSQVEYAFRHPLIRAVAYESQLKSDRAELHRRLASAIEQQAPESADENAALIAEHLAAAGDLHSAFAWHMRAGTWLTHRDLAAARASWQHARHVADLLPDADPQRTAMRIAPRTLLCGSAWLAGGSMSDTGYDDLRRLALAADDKVSLSMAIAGQVGALIVHADFDEASHLASELTELLASLGDRNLSLGLLYTAFAAKLQSGELTETKRLTEHTIELADNDAHRGNLIIGSPLVVAIMIRGCARCCLGELGWKDDVDQALAMARGLDATTYALMLLFQSFVIVINGAWMPDATTVQETAEALSSAERSGDDFAVACARYAHGVALMGVGGYQHDEALALLASASEAGLQERFTVALVWFIHTHLAHEKIRADQFDDAVELARTAVESEFASGEMVVLAAATAALVEALLRRNEPTDVTDASAIIDRLAVVPTEPGSVINEIWLLRMRALLARAHDDEATYRVYRERYRDMANSLGFEGHIVWAEALT